MNDVGSAPSPMCPSWMENTGIASTAITATPDTRNVHGRRATRCAYVCQVPCGSTPGSVSATGFRTRQRSIRPPASPSSAGTRVSAPRTAETTVTAAASPSLAMNETPEADSPASATITVQPDTSTARPLVEVACPAARTGSVPFIRSCR